MDPDVRQSNEKRNEAIASKNIKTVLVNKEQGQTFLAFVENVTDATAEGRPLVVAFAL